jgi:hypothetical protein
MAILDKKLEFCDAMSIAGAVAATKASTNTINLGSGYNCWNDAIGNNIGEGGDLWLNVRLPTAIAPVSTCHRISLMTGDTAASCVTFWNAATVAFWSFMASDPKSKTGKTLIRYKIPPGYDDGLGVYQPLGAFLALNFQNMGTTCTAGNVDAWIGLDSESEVPRS